MLKICLCIIGFLLASAIISTAYVTIKLLPLLLLLAFVGFLIWKFKK